MELPFLTPALYRHRELEGGRGNRLLKVLRHNDSSTCTYKIIETSLDGAPLYEAVSYVWGEVVCLEELHLQPSTTFLNITSSLASALVYLTQNCRTNHLWIDQICINQGNMSERNQQLGDEDCDSLHLAAIFEYVAASTTKNESFDDFSQGVHHLLGDTGDPSNNRRQRSVRELLCRPWFSRAWVVQEAVLARSAAYITGSLIFDIHALWSMTRKVRNVEDRRKGENEQMQSIRQTPGYLLLNEIITLRKQQQTQAETAKRSFFNALSVLAPRCRTSVPNDKILAFLGLLNDPRIHLELDYNISLDVLPIITTLSIIHGTGSLDIFGVLHCISGDESQWSKLPSWVPNLTKCLKAESISFPENPTYFNASAGYTHKKRSPVPAPDAELFVYRKIIDEISFRIPFTEDLPAPASSRQEWDVHKYLRHFELQQVLKATWPSNRPALTADYILVTALADGSFAFDKKERSECRNGLSKEQKTGLLNTYESLDPRSPGYGSRTQRKRRLSTTLRDHARIAWGRAIIVSRHRWTLGLAHESARTGDLIAIIHGSTVPLVLRKVDGNFYRLVGQCYLEGVMRGEAVLWSEADADEFCLT